MSETTKKKTGLAAALLEAQKEASALEKNARNEHHRYDYVSSDSMIEEGRRVLTKAGLTLQTVGWSVTLDGPTIRVKGEYDQATKAADYYEVQCQMVAIKLELHHAESGENASYEVNCPVVVEKGRPPDKALFGALTEGLAYFIRGLLLIPRIEGEKDNTPSARDDRNYEPPKQRPKTAAPKPGDVLDAFEQLVASKLMGNGEFDAIARKTIPNWDKLCPTPEKWPNTVKALPTAEARKLYKAIEEWKPPDLGADADKEADND